MNIHQFPGVCDICGGEGMGTIRTAGAMWDRNSEVRHNDPRICASNLARRARELDQREKDMA